MQPDLIYYWTHAETVATAPPTPGRLSQAAWPPALGMAMGPSGVSGIPVAQGTGSRPGAKYTEAGRYKNKMIQDWLGHLKKKRKEKC